MPSQHSEHTTEPLADDDLLDVERRRGNTYKLLAECYHEPDDDLVELLSTVTDEDVAVSDVTLRNATTDLDTLRVEYAKLFVGPFELQAPPYESTYVDDSGRVMTRSTAEVIEAYRQEGLDVGLDEPPDHVSAELEFVYVLVAEEVEALAAGDIEAATASLRRQYEFLSSHLGRWVSELSENVLEHADTEFYRALADETRDFVEGDGKRLADRLDRLEDPDTDLLAVIEGGESDDD